MMNSIFNKWFLGALYLPQWIEARGGLNHTERSQICAWRVYDNTKDRLLSAALLHKLGKELSKVRRRRVSDKTSTAKGTSLTREIFSVVTVWVAMSTFFMRRRGGHPYCDEFPQIVAYTRFTTCPWSGQFRKCRASFPKRDHDPPPERVPLHRPDISKASWKDHSVGN